MNLARKLKNIPLDEYTTDCLEKVLVNSKESKQKNRIIHLIQSDNTFKQQNTNKLLELLNYTHIESPKLETVYPSVVTNFLNYKLRNKKEKVDFVASYGNLLSLSHTITFLNKQNATDMVDRYNKLWKHTQIEYFSQQKPYDQVQMESTPMNKILQLNFNCETPYASNVQHIATTEELKKLIHLRQQYNSKLNLKLGPPLLKLELDADRFGGPIAPCRVFNKRLNRLIKLQQFYLKTRPVSKETMKVFNAMDLAGMDGLMREAYCTFVDNIFYIDNNCELNKSDIDLHRKQMSEEIKNLYDLAKI